MDPNTISQRMHENEDAATDDCCPECGEPFCDCADWVDEEAEQEADNATLLEDLQALVSGDIDTSEFSQIHEPTRFESFAEAGVLTMDKGFCFCWHGRRVYVTVQVQ